MIEGLFRGDKVKERPYYQKYAPTVDWEWMLVLGVVMNWYKRCIRFILKLGWAECCADFAENKIAWEAL